jgi:hypothetical protein
MIRFDLPDSVRHQAHPGFAVPVSFGHWLGKLDSIDEPLPFHILRIRKASPRSGAIVWEDDVLWDWLAG